MKVCSNPKCSHKGKSQMESNFSKHNNFPDGLQYWCKDCANKNAKKCYAENPERGKKRSTEWAKKNPEKHREFAKKSQKEKYKNDPEYRERIKKTMRQNYHLKKSLNKTQKPENPIK